MGGGAAGLFAAIKAAEGGAKVILLEKTNQLLSKVRISGGGRCNVTHACFDPQKLAAHYPRGHKELIGPFHRFQPRDTIAWFKERGVVLKTEPDGRMFPITDSSETIIQCLLHAASQAGVDIHKMQRIETITKEDDQFIVGPYRADALILATGSSSFGHRIAEQFGHTIVPPVPSLFTFNVPSSPLLDLPGIAIPNVILTIKETGHSQQGPLLLTHWGFSGPAALKLSAWAARELHALHYQATLLINWLAAPSQEALYQALLAKTVSLPVNLARRLLVHPSPKVQAEKLYRDVYKIEGTTTNKQEFVTAGGVNLKEIDFKTFESRLSPGLFFAGEILNIDGITGGFNFQHAWTSGFLAGIACQKKP